MKNISQMEEVLYKFIRMFGEQATLKDIKETFTNLKELTLGDSNE